MSDSTDRYAILKAREPELDVEFDEIETEYQTDTSTEGIARLALAAIQDLARVKESDRIEAINEIRKGLHEISPFKNEPVDCVLWIKCDDVKANVQLAHFGCNSSKGARGSQQLALVG